MAYSKQDLIEIAKLIRKDIGMAQAKLTDLIEGITSLPSSDKPKQYATCPRCGAPLKPATKERLDEHLENVHGQVPA